LPFKTRPIQEG